VAGDEKLIMSEWTPPPERRTKPELSALVVRASTSGSMVMCGISKGEIKTEWQKRNCRLWEGREEGKSDEIADGGSSTPFASSRAQPPGLRVEKKTLSFSS